MDRPSNNRRKPLPFRRVEASNPRGSHSPPMMTKHDGLPQHPTPEDLRVAQGNQTSDAQGTKHHYGPQPKQTSAAPARMSPNDDVSTRLLKCPSLARSHDDNIVMDDPGHETGLLESKSFPPGKPGSLVQEKLPLSPDDRRCMEQAGYGGKEVVMVHMLPLPVDGVHKLPAGPSNPGPADNIESPHQPAPHRPETPRNNSSDGGDGDKVDSTTNTLPVDGGLPITRTGLPRLYDMEDEVIQLLDRLFEVQYIFCTSEQESMYQSGRDSALRDVQESLLRRSGHSHVGTAEGRILRREATKLDGMRDKARNEEAKALEMSKGLEDPAFVAGDLCESILILSGEALSALITVERPTGQAETEAGSSGSTPEAAARPAQYPVWKDHRLVSLTTERRVLEIQVGELEKEKLKQLEDISRLQKQVDDLQAHQSAAITRWQEVPQSLVPGPPVPNSRLQPVRDNPGSFQRASGNQNLENGSGRECES